MSDEHPSRDELEAQTPQETTEDNDLTRERLPPEYFMFGEMPRRKSNKIVLFNFGGSPRNSGGISNAIKFWHDKSGFKLEPTYRRAPINSQNNSSLNEYELKAEYIIDNILSRFIEYTCLVFNEHIKIYPSVKDLVHTARTWIDVQLEQILKQLDKDSESKYLSLTGDGGGILKSKYGDKIISISNNIRNICWYQSEEFIKRFESDYDQSSIQERLDLLEAEFPGAGVRASQLFPELSSTLEGITEGVTEKPNSPAEDLGLEKLIDLLRRMGVEESVADAIREEIKRSDSVSILTPQNDSKINFDDVLSETQAKAALNRVEDGYGSRILAERRDPASDSTVSASRPTSWEEATAAVPKLRRWVEVKREGLADGRPLRDILISHLRNHESGLGFWVASGIDFPVRALMHFDQSLRQEIGNPAQWDFPEDVRIISGTRGRPAGSLDSEPRAFAPRPNRQPRESQDQGVEREKRVSPPTSDEVREAWRIAKRAQRRGLAD